MEVDLVRLVADLFCTFNPVLLRTVHDSSCIQQASILKQKALEFESAKVRCLGRVRFVDRGERCLAVAIPGMYSAWEAAFQSSGPCTTRFSIACTHLRSYMKSYDITHIS